MRPTTSWPAWPGSQAAGESDPVIVTTDKDLLQVVDGDDVRLQSLQGEHARRGRGQGVLRGRGLPGRRRPLPLGGPVRQHPRRAGDRGKDGQDRSSRSSARSRSSSRTSTGSRTPGSGKRSSRTSRTLELSRKLVDRRKGPGPALSTSTSSLFSEPDAEEAARIFRELEFTSLLSAFRKTARRGPEGYTTHPGREGARSAGRRPEEVRGLRPRYGDRQPLPDPGPARRHVVRHRSPARRFISRSGTITSAPRPRSRSKRPSSILKARPRGPRDPKIGPEHQVRPHRPPARGDRTPGDRDRIRWSSPISSSPTGASTASSGSRSTTSGRRKSPTKASPARARNR